MQEKSLIPDKFEKPVNFTCFDIEEPSAAHPWTDEERKRAKKILEEAEANGQIDLSQFCVPVELEQVSKL